MKKYLTLLPLLFCSAISYASEVCVTELSSSSKYDDLNKILACFNKKIKASETEIKTLEAQAVKAEAKIKALETKVAKPEKPTDNPRNGIVLDVPKSKNQTVKVGNLTFNLLHCTRNRETIVCELSIASKIDTTLIVNPRNFYSQYFTIAISTSGVQYSAAWTSLGASSQARSASYRMLSGIPLKSLINFSSVPSDEKGFALLEVLTNHAKVQFRDINFTE